MDMPPKSLSPQAADPQTEVMTPQDQAIGAVHRLSGFWRDRMELKYAHLFFGVTWSGLAAIGVMTHPEWMQRGERLIQSALWQVQPATIVPPEIVILGIDETTQGRIARWPLPRSAYAQVIDKVMQAGASGVALDILLDNPSDTPDDKVVTDDCDRVKPSPADRQLREAIGRYPGKITLATSFTQSNDGADDLSQRRLLVPFCPFQTVQARFGNIDFPAEWPGDGRTQEAPVYRSGAVFLQDLIRTDPTVYQAQINDYGITSFAAAALQSAGITDRGKARPEKAEDIYFYGGWGKFETFSLSDVLQPENWQSRFQSGAYFRGKLVLIGATDGTLSDIKDTARGKMPGVELHANAIATMMQGKALRPLLPQPGAIGAVVLLGGLIAALIQSRGEKTSWRLFWTLLLMLGWGGAGYGLMTQASLLLPMLLPMGAIGATGLSYVSFDVIKNRRTRKQLADSLKDQSRNPVVRAIINQQTDETLKKELLEGRQQELLGAKIGGERYQVIQIHGAGGFGETYIAEDLHRPDRPKCVVKKLSPASRDTKHMNLARRLFQREAETLEILGKQHDQIPQLLAYFEESTEFYLVQEFIDGNPLNTEISLGRLLPEAKAIAVLREILQILQFVHSQGVIHRDVKPSNLIRRARDNKLVLIDFGAVKGVQILSDDEIISELTIGIGTQGYMAPEQQAGHPQFNSDIYALGMMGVQMLTGISPSQLKRDVATGEVDWHSKTHASVGLIEVVSKMIAYNYKQRYQSTPEVLQVLKNLSYQAAIPAILSELRQDSVLGNAEDLQDTRPWPAQFDDGDGELPPTEPPPTV
jgi:CHASE2 domain-containing sensor protein/tRNA A-37 threonylcarbamoyl transferase component Bud32